MAMGAGGSGKGLLGEMNVTPMIDVLLVLLVIFMIITPLTPMGEKAVIPQPPPKNAKPQPNNPSIVLQMLPASGPGTAPQLEINHQNVSWQNLTSKLLDIYKTRAKKVMFLKADSSIPWKDVAMAIDDAHGAGVNSVGLITSKIQTS
jgi:biopolymer transport protein TolR